MAATNRPATLVVGWRGAWGLNVRRALVAVRDEGPLSLEEVARVMRWTALHSDLTSGHNLGPDHGAHMLARAILEDAADVVSVDDDGRYSLPSGITSFTSPYTGDVLRLLTPDEQATAKAKNDAERPVRRWMASDVYSPFGGKWTDGQLPGRKWTTDDVVEMAETIAALGWLPGSRIVKDQRGVIIEGHLRYAALGLLAIDPNTGTDPRSGEPYVEIQAFNNDAARLDFALTANWSTLKAPTRNAISHQVLGDAPLTLDAVVRLIRPMADIMKAPAEVTDVSTAAEEPPVQEPVAPPVSKAPKELTDDDLDMIAAIDRCGHYGATQAELRMFDIEQGSITGRLSRLTDGGHIIKLAQRRDGSGVYVTPTWRADRALGKRRSEGRLSAVPRKPPPPPTPPVAWSNEDLATMPFDEVFAGLSFNNQNARVTIVSGIRHDQPVADHVAGIVADFNAKCPGLLDLMCDYRAATRLP